MKISLIEKEQNTITRNGIFCMIRDLVNSKNLELGDKLPSERIMSEKFGVNRNQIREAIRKLEFYGVLKTLPQSSTVLSIGLIAFNGIINEIISLDKPTFRELVETRITIELKSVVLAAKRRSDSDLQNIESCLESFKDRILNEEDHLQEYILFHVSIAKASKNNTLVTLMLLITTPIIATYDKDAICVGDAAIAAIKKHETIFLAIKNKDEKMAQQAMEQHFNELSNFINS